MTDLCWEEKSNGKYCKNYRLDGKIKCKHHNHDNHDNFKMYLMTFLLVTVISIHYYKQNESDVNLYIYMIINNICKNINKLGYNICISLENYRKVYNEKILIKQGYGLENVKMYVNSTLNYLNDYFKMYDSFLFNYTMKNIHDFILKNIINKIS